jgi:hypothetical protein
LGGILFIVRNSTGFPILYNLGPAFVSEENTMPNVKYVSLIILVALLVGVWVWAVSAWTKDIPMSDWIALGFGGLLPLSWVAG